MIQTEFYETREDGVNLYRTFSDEGYMIKCDQTDAVYDEAVDSENSGYTYSETNVKVEEPVVEQEERPHQRGRRNNNALNN